MVAPGFSQQFGDTDFSHTQRQTIAIIPLVNKTGDAGFSYWSHSMFSTVFTELKQIKNIHVFSSDKKVLSEINLLSGSKEEASKANYFGEQIGANWVLWGNYQLFNQQWLLQIFLLNIKSGQIFDNVSTTSSNWVDKRIWFAKQILLDLRMSPTEGETKNIRRCWTDLPLAAQYYGQAMDAKNLEGQEILLQEAVKTDPEFLYARVSLASVLIREGKTEDALRLIKKIHETSPDDARLNKVYGLLFSSLGMYNEATQKYLKSVSLDPDDGETFELLGDAYTRMYQLPEAIISFKQALKLDRFAEFSPKVNASIDYWNPRQFATCFDVQEQWLNFEHNVPTMLRQKLNPSELSLVKNPLEFNAEMKNWATKITADKANTEDKAKLLLNAIILHQSVQLQTQPSFPQTAVETFKQLSGPATAPNCENQAFLYVAVARSIGMKAKFVLVDRDYDGEQNLHACAAMVISNKFVLVDPVAYWFGIPHKKFQVLDDIQTIGVFQSSFPGLQNKLIAAKLAPNIALVQYNLFFEYVILHHWPEAEALIPSIMQNDCTGALTLSAQAALAMHIHDPNKAVDLLYKAVGIYPHDARLYIQLGAAYAEIQNSSKVRECFEKALDCPHSKDDIAMINEIDDSLNALAEENYFRGSDEFKSGNFLGARSDFVNSLKFNPNFAEAYNSLGIMDQKEGNWNAAVTEFQKAIELKPSMYQAYNNLGYVFEQKGELTGASSNYDKVVSLNPQLALHIASGFQRIGCYYFAWHDYTNAETAFTRALSLDNSDNYTYLLIWLANCKLGDAVQATKSLAAELSKNSRKSDWNLKIGSFLTGRLPESELIQSADNSDPVTDREQHFQAFFFDAFKHLFDGDKTAAVNYYQKCVSIKTSDLAAFNVAKSELISLKANLSHY